MSSVRLTETSYIVLGLVEQLESATPYDLKQAARIGVFDFWSIPHTQIYSECARLAREGLLSERQEPAGRRRRVYRLTAQGSRALASWRAEPTAELYEMRDPGTLKLFFGGDPATLAASQLEAHRRKLEAFEQLHAESADLPRGMRLALEVGIGHEREFVRFWSALARSG